MATATTKSQPRRTRMPDFDPPLRTDVTASIHPANLLSLKLDEKHVIGKSALQAGAEALREAYSFIASVNDAETGLEKLKPWKKTPQKRIDGTSDHLGKLRTSFLMEREKFGGHEEELIGVTEKAFKRVSLALERRQ